MQKLIETTKQIIQQKESLPFSVYSSIKEQHLLNVPVIKPLLIFVLSGSKGLGIENPITCRAGNFVFLSNTPSIVMRNIPDDAEYFALLIEFEYSDFDGLENRTHKTENYFQGPIDKTLEFTLQQFVEWSAVSTSDIWSLRRQEILRILSYLGFDKVGAIIEPPSLSHKLHTLISTNPLRNCPRQATSLRACA